jgi:hypothetical protein
VAYGSSLVERRLEGPEVSYFEDQYDEWMANNCQGDIEEYGDGSTYIEAAKGYTPPPPNKVRTSMGRSRSLLPLSKVEEFAAWAIADGFVREETKGVYEVLRLRWGQKVNGRKMQPYIFFKRAAAHYATTQAEGTQLVSRWMRPNTTT